MAEHSLKIGISIAGVHWEDGSKYRYRNYEDAVNEFNTNIIQSLIDLGHEPYVFLYTYSTPKINQLLNAYTHFTDAVIVDENNQWIPSGQSVQAVNIIRGLDTLKGLNLDFIIRARFDQKFLLNPFKEYNWDWNKANFLWREPAHHDLPLLNDTFFGWPAKWTEQIQHTIEDSELRPYNGIRIALHNLYRPLAEKIGEENIKLLDDRYVTKEWNKLYKLTRHE